MFTPSPPSYFPSSPHQQVSIHAQTVSFKPNTPPLTRKNPGRFVRQAQDCAKQGILTQFHIQTSTNNQSQLPLTPPQLSVITILISTPHSIAHPSSLIPKLHFYPPPSSFATPSDHSWSGFSSNFTLGANKKKSEYHTSTRNDKPITAFSRLNSILSFDYPRIGG